MSDTAGSAALAVRQVTKQFPPVGKNPAVHALGPVDLELTHGEFFGVVGPSGCGKTTLLEIAAGLTAPTDGEVLVRGVPINAQIPEGVGIVFQEDTCFPWLSVHDNIAFGLRRNGAPAELVCERVERILAFMGLERFRHAHPAQLSGGMRQRVSIARVLVLEPKIIFLDEPFGALDQQTRLHMGDELLRIWRSTGATVLLITHSLDEAAMLSDRIGVMSSRPGRFIDVVTTNWPRARDSSLVANPAFGEVTARLWRSLREESRRALEATV